jgi:hypothetical protein
MAAIDLHIGEHGGDHIRIRVVKRTEQVIRDHWDANWLATEIRVSVGGWKGKNDKAYFRTEELSGLRSKVELIAEGKLGDAEFAPMEPHLRVRFAVAEEDGPVLVTGTALDRLEDGNVLTFRIAMGLEALEALAVKLRAVEKAWPTIGKS